MIEGVLEIKSYFYLFINIFYEVAQSVSCLTTDWTTSVRSLVLPLGSVSRPAPKPTQPSIQWVPAVNSRR
jgi:hypothetical protein